MQKKLVKYLSLFIVVISIFTVTVSATENYETFSYSYEGKLQITPDAYTVNSVIAKIPGAGTLKEAKDILYDDKTGYIYIADSGNNRIVVVNEDFEMVKSISKFKNNGKDDSLLNPMGIYITEDGYIYVADTDNGRIVIFNKDFSFYKELPPLSADILPKNFKYNPKAVAVDNAKRVYVVSQNTNMGIIVLDEDGNFESFIGAQRVSANPIELLWRTFMTEEQIERSTSFVPVEYSNLTIDEKGFIYVTCSQIDRYDLYSYIWERSSTSTYAPVKKINPSGTDVLKRNGFFPPSGNILFDAYTGKASVEPSEISEVELLENGLYALVSSNENRMYFYDSNGNLLYAFGGEGNSAGLFNELSAITHNNDCLYALDSISGNITIFEKTEYGSLIDKVLYYQESRQYDKASNLWEEILSKNNNFDMAYLGLGKNLLEAGEYAEAMSYFRLIGNKTYYGQAFKLYREELLEKYGVAIFIIAILLISVLFFIFKKIKKHNDKMLEKPASGKLSDQLLYAFFILRHPIQGFWGIKAERRGGFKSATIILITTMISSLVATLGGAYLSKEDSGSIVSALTIILGLLLFVLCNMCFTSLMDGKGTFKDVYIAVSYSTVPYTLFTIPCTVLSYVLITDELSILQMFTTVVFIWMLSLILIGSMTVHEYSFSKNLLVCVLTIVGMLFILFIALVFISLSGQMISAVNSIINELNYRM